MEKEKAEEFTNKYACHKGRGFVLPKENDFFCPDDSCQFCGPLDSVLGHVKDVHSVAIHHFCYGHVMRIPLHLVGKYLVLSAEDGTAFVLWGVDFGSGMKLSVVCAKQASSCGSEFTFDVTYGSSREVLCWRKGERFISTDKKVWSCDTVGSSIIMYEKNADVRGIASAKCRIRRSHVSNSNLGDMFVDSKQSGLFVPKTCNRDGKLCGDIILSISTV
jgi:hypothetical protein